MSQQSAIKRPRTKLWQFSIAQLLVLTFLVAIVFAAFRWHPLAGILACFICVGLPIIVMRTKAAIRHREPLWNELELPDCIRSEQTIPLVIWSFCVVFLAPFLFFIGALFAGFVAFFVIQAIFPLPRSPSVKPTLIQELHEFLFFAFILGTGILFAVGWLWSTWPKPPQTRSALHPSAKTV